MEDFDFNDTAPAPLSEQEFLMENLCVKKGRAPGGYEPPATRSAAKRWKNVHEQSMMLRLNEMHIIKKQNAQMSKEAAREIIRKIPVELLAKEWLSKEDATVDMRAYLVDHILPTLILGVERLLKEVEEKGLSATNRFEPEFNPINFLAQYLMRNNPRFSNFAEASPYVRGLREVSEEIKQELFTFEDNRLARIKAETRRKRTDRERHEQQIQEEKDRRQAQLISHFKEWIGNTEETTVELSLLQNALRAFTETVEQLPPDTQEVAKFGQPLEPTDETGKTLGVKDFAKYISLFVEDLPFEIFQLFMVHMSKCAAAHKASADRDNRKTILTNLFLICDYGVLGLLDRARILTLCEMFWDSLMDAKDPVGTLRNPRRWPIVEVNEVDDILFDAWHEEPDGGVTPKEARIQEKQFLAIKNALDQEVEIIAAKDKIAKKKWKEEQLLQKSEGSLKKQKTLGRDTVNGDTVAGIETAEGDNTVNGDTVAGDETTEQEDVTEEIDMITSENAGKKSEETINDDDNDHTPADAPAEDEEVREATAREEIKEDAAKSVGEDTTDSAAEATANEGAEGTADEHAGKSEELFHSEESQQIPAGDEQKRESATEEKADTEEIIKTNEEIKEKDEDCREVSDFATSDETGNANRICSDTTVGEHPAGGFKGQGEAEKEVTAQVVGDETAVREQAAEANILKDLAAEQAKILASRSRRSSVNTVTESEPLGTTTLQRESVTMSAFNENYLNLAQFVQLMETFIGHHPDSSVFATLVHYLTDNYQDTESEKTDRLLDARNAATQAKRKATLNNLFEKWDNDASGFLDLDNVVDVMCKFKEGQEIEVIRLAQSNLKKQSTYHDQRLSKGEFRQFIKLVVDEIPGPETFDILVEFLVNSVERSYAERIRGEARKKWLEQIIIVAQTTGTSMEPVYKAVFQALYRDAETHGGEKRISASIAILEVNKLAKSRGPLLLRYAACTPEDCQYMLGKPLYKNMKGVSFQAVETGRPIHVPRVANHGSVYFWNYDRRPEKRSGSFVVVPIKDKQKRVFGVLGVDTMIDPNESTIFVTHEVHFFQGVAKAFSIAYHLVEKRRKFLRAMESAVLWMSRHCPHIVDITVYFVEPNTRVPGDYILRKVMIKDKQGGAVNISEVIRLERKDSLFRNYLFECMETSETVTAELDGARHIASPLRDDAGVTVGIVDLSLGELKNLPRYESKEAQRMLRLLQRAHKELTKISMGDEPDCVLEIESDVIARVEILYERLMLQELRDNIDRIDPASFSEITTYYEPPRVIAEVLRATLAVLKVDQVGEGEYDDWDDLKNCISSEFMQQIIAYDPTAAANPDSEKVEKYLRATFNVPFAEIARQGNILAQQLYSWVSVCLSLIEYTRKMKENIENNMLEAAGDEMKEPTFTVV